MIKNKVLVKRPEYMPTLVLAYIGDAVYELAVRQHLALQGPAKMDRLHREVVQYVRAPAQAKILRMLEGFLNEEELSVVRRGRNAKITHCPKGAGVIEYHYSTAFESLIGYLYLKGDSQRLETLLNIAFNNMQLEKNS